MPISLSEALLYALAPALLGLALAVVLVLRAKSDLATPLDQQAQGRFMVLLAIPLTAPILAFVAAQSASTSGADGLMLPLLALGAAALVQCIAQGIIGAKNLATVATNPLAFGRVIMMLALPEVLTIGALLWVFLTTGNATTGTT